MKKITICIIALTLVVHVFAQRKQTNKIQAGVELDLLPYATGGYFGAVWAGKDLWRVRLLNAGVNMPDFVTANGFTNRHINSWALVADRFFKQSWKGWWLGGGAVLWQNSIQTTAHLQTAHFNNFLLNGSAGYNISLHKHVYLSPWAGMSLRVAGDRNVTVDNQKYTVPFFNPEASIKLGYYF